MSRRGGRRLMRGIWDPSRRQYLLRCDVCDTMELLGWKTPAQLNDGATRHHLFWHLRLLAYAQIITKEARSDG